jgi:5-methyltetrahydropteroyltriglutamate--homocysteine methyltransferase
LQTAALKTSDHRRATPVGTRLEEQQKHLNLPILPTTTIGSFPQTPEIRRVRREVKSKKISEEEYEKAIKAEIDSVVKLQEDLDIDVLVHGEPEVEIYCSPTSSYHVMRGSVCVYGSLCAISIYPFLKCQYFL